jgi:hypothetical protein
MTIEEIKTEAKEKFFSEFKINADLSYLNYEDINDFDELRDEAENNSLLDSEVIYYSVAIKYLQENDPSLSESLEIASEYGYTTENLNSELLATLLKSRETRNEFEEIEEEATQFFEALEEAEAEAESLNNEKIQISYFQNLINNL